MKTRILITALISLMVPACLSIDAQGYLFLPSLWLGICQDCYLLAGCGHLLKRF